MTTHVTDELLPCPFCGSTNLTAFQNDVLCDDCSASGPDLGHTKDMQGAIAAWNRRSLSSDSVSDGSKGVGALIGYLWQEMCELPDRSSPEEYPDMALVTLGELTAIVDTFFERQRLHALDSPAAMKPFVYGLRDIRNGMPHFDEMCISVDRNDLEEHIEGDESLEVIALYLSPTEPKAGVVSYSLADCKQLVEAVVEHCQGPDWDCDTKAAVKSVYAALNGDKP